MTRRDKTVLANGILLLAFLSACGSAQPVQPKHPDCPLAPHADGAENPHKSHDAHHRFDNAQQWEPVFESAERDAWQKGDAVVANLGIAANARIADIGAATGYFSVRFARAAPAGQVWGVDIEADMVRFLGERARREGLANLHPLLGLPEDPRLPEPVDWLFLCDTYHHIADRAAWFRNARRYLAPQGRLAIVDFTLGDIPVGPPKHQRVGPEAMQRELEGAGFVLLSRNDTLLPYQHVLVFGIATERRPLP